MVDYRSLACRPVSCHALVSSTTWCNHRDLGRKSEFPVHFVTDRGIAWRVGCRAGGRGRRGNGFWCVGSMVCWSMVRVLRCGRRSTLQAMLPLCHGSLLGVRCRCNVPGTASRRPECAATCLARQYSAYLTVTGRLSPTTSRSARRSTR